MKTIGIRVDGNQNIGTGHVMRCLSIAEQIKKLGSKVIFITADNKMLNIVQSKGFEYICLDTIWNNMDSELPALYSVIKELDFNLILVDSYYVTKNYLESLRKHITVYYIDDVNSMEYPVDALINYNIYGEEAGYSKAAYNRLYLGPTYAPLRSEFMNKAPREYKGVEKLLITSGGTDEYNVVGNILESFSKMSGWSEMIYYCVLGRFNKNIDNLVSTYGSMDNVHFLVDIKNISYYMSICDVAITAGGSTCYELCACGIPSIIYTLADNQLEIAKTFSKRGIMPWVGDVRMDITVCIEKIIQEIISLKNKSYWEKCSAQMQSLVDGKGALRLAKVIIGLDRKDII